jgi:Bacteriophage lambda head decoration protein D
MLLSTDTLRFSNTVKHEYEPAMAYCREVVTLNEAAGATYPIGTVLGKVTATGKYKRVEATAVDGSQTAVAVTIADVTVVANTDAKVVVLARGPAMVSKSALSFGASVDTAPEFATAYSQLATVGILVQDTI